MKSKEKTHMLRNKSLFTLIVLIVFIVCRKIPLSFINLDMYESVSFNVETFIQSTLAGAKQNCYILSLGITPYITSSLVVQMVLLLINSEARGRISPKKIKYATAAMTVLLALIQSILLSEKLMYQDTINNIILVKTIVVAELAAGAFIIILLALLNKEYGIGGPTVIVLVNMLDHLLSTIWNRSYHELLTPMIISIGVVIVMLIMENYEKKIPLQRISIHNIYADKNYIAIKLAPVGVLPVMFTSAIFMIPQTFVSFLLMTINGNETLSWVAENLVLTKQLGIVVYLILLFIITIVFSFLFISPSTITEQLLKNGDSIVNIHPERDTNIYISKILLLFSCISALIMCICLGFPLVLQLEGIMDSSLALVPSSIMFLTGICCNLYREIKSLKDYDSYKRFI